MNVDEILQQLMAAHPRVAAMSRSRDVGAENDVALLNEIFAGYEQSLQDLEAAEDARRYLTEASLTLGSSLDYRATLTSVARLLVPHLADWCAVDMVEADGSYQRLAIAHMDPAKEALAWELERRYGFPPDAPQGAAKVLRRGQPELYSEIPDALLVEAAADEEHLALLRSIGLKSGIIVPLVARGRVLGAISLGTAESGRRLGTSDLALAQDLATRAALAIDNARLYSEAREAIQRQDESLALLDTLLANAPVGLGFWDRDLRYVRINAALAAINGLTPEEHIGRRINEVLRDLGEELAAVYRGVLETGEPIVNQEVTGETPAAPGKRRYWLASYYPVRASDGRGTIGVGGVVTEITERKQAEEELRASRDQLEIILRGVTDGITVQDPSGKLVYANAAAARLIGYPSAQALQSASIQEVMQRSEVMDESGRPFPLAQLPGCRALQGEAQVQALLRFRVAATGEERWSLVHASPVVDERCQVKLAINIFQDVTERRRTEENLRSLAEASALLSSSLDYRSTLSELARLIVPRIADWCAVDVLDQDGSYQRLAVAHVDPAKVDLAHEVQRRYPVDPAARRGVPEVIRTSQPELYSDLSDNILAVAARDVEHLELLRSLGFKSAMIVPLISGGQALGAITFVSAESGRRFTEVDLRFAEDLARRAGLALHNARLFDETRHAVRARDEFLSIAAHELKTPVTTLLGYSQVLQRRFAREDAASDRDRRAVQVIGDQAQRLGRLISLLLDLSRIQTGHFSLERKAVDLCAVVRRVVEDASSALDHHSLDLVSAENSLIVHGDDLRLEQMFQNLIQNAIKYSPDGGRITIRMERQDGMAVVVVTDQGIGIPREAQAELFQRFYRATNVERSHISGLGIGLYVVKEIAMRHDGMVEVESDEGKGSAFTIKLPLVTNDQP